MNREQIEKAFEENADYNPDAGYFINKQDFITVVQELLPKWINVKDRLPKLNTRCLCIEADREPQMATYCKSFWINTRAKEYEVGFLDEQDEQPSSLTPTHWMPLPTPPNQ